MIYSVHQPHYLPYPGYLAKVALSDAFVFLEDVQYTKRDYQNRNKVKGPNGAQWLTIPVKGEYKSKIREMRIDYSAGWQKKHIETIRRFYSKSVHQEYLDSFADIIDEEFDCLSDLTMRTTEFFVESFHISTDIRTQMSFLSLPEDPNERIIAIGKQLGADTYLAGSGGKNYMNLALFEAADIKVLFQDVIPVSYPQLHGEFIPHMGSIDLLLNTGPDGYDTYVAPHFKLYQ